MNLERTEVCAKPGPWGGTKDGEEALTEDRWRECGRRMVTVGIKL